MHVDWIAHANHSSLALFAIKFEINLYAYVLQEINLVFNEESTLAIASARFGVLS